MRNGHAPSNMSSTRLRRRRSHDDDVGTARKADVVQCVAGAEYLRVDLSPGHGLESDSADELPRRARHHHVHFGTGLCKQTRQPH